MPSRGANLLLPDLVSAEIACTLMDALSSSVVGLRLAETTASIQYAVAARVLQAGQSSGDVALKLIEAAQTSFDQAVANVSDALSAQLDLYA